MQIKIKKPRHSGSTDPPAPGLWLHIHDALVASSAHRIAISPVQFDPSLSQIPAATGIPVWLRCGGGTAVLLNEKHWPTLSSVEVGADFMLNGTLATPHRYITGTADGAVIKRSLPIPAMYICDLNRINKLIPFPISLAKLFKDFIYFIHFHNPISIPLSGSRSSYLA